MGAREPRHSRYEDEANRLIAKVEAAAKAEDDWDDRLSAGLRAGLDFLAADPAAARLLLVESLDVAAPVRLEHERSLARLADALRPPPERSGGELVPLETVRLLAGGLVSHLSGRALAGEAERIGDDHDLLLEYLLAPYRYTF